jgi:4'-phosphopantetheinyl transferase EntD
MAAALIATAHDADSRVVENAAESALEHHLGLTCDPVAGYVQVPCIERCAFGAVKAWTAYAIASNEIANNHRVGLDIEVPVERIRKIQHKYLEEEESLMLLEDQPEACQVKRLTLAWSAKESIFKWYSLGEMDFKLHMHLHRLVSTGDSGSIKASLTKPDLVQLLLSFRFFEPLVLSWLATINPEKEIP